MTLPQLVVFDMIGTTILATDRIPEAFSWAFDQHGVSLAGSDIDSVRGKSKRQAIHELLVSRVGSDFADDRADNVYDSFKERLLASYDDESVTAIPGAEAAFEWCRDNGIQIALTTGFDHELAELLVHRLGWSTAIDVLVCNDDVENGRPAPDLILCAMRIAGVDDAAGVASVGDTVADLEAGANAGTGWNIGVLSGAHSAEQLVNAPHTRIIVSVADIPRALGGKGGST